MSALRSKWTQASDYLSDSNALLSALESDQAGFVRLAGLLKRIAGIHLPHSSKNVALMSSRLSRLLREKALPSYAALAERIERGHPELTREFISALTTNTTHFFREEKHFDVLKSLLPSILKANRAQGRNELRVWCAASSTGQEPYTLLMSLLEAEPQFSNGSLSLKMLATDIDLEVLATAARGAYTERELDSVPALFRQKYFSFFKRGSEKYGVIDPKHRDLIRFAPFNLLEPSYPFKHPFDVIFCRNVLIYFDPATCDAVIGRMITALSPTGHLFLGHSESGTQKHRNVRPIAHSVYQRIPGKTGGPQ